MSADDAAQVTVHLIFPTGCDQRNVVFGAEYDVKIELGV